MRKKAPQRERPTAKNWRGDVAAWRGLHVAGRVPLILTDQRVRAFVTKELRTCTFSAVALACREKFGPERAPSRATIARYWAQLAGRK